jgi:5-methylcytosine-specific restriction endonuclease McrA
MKQTLLLNYLEPRSNYNSGKALSLVKWRKEVLGRDSNICKNCFNAIKDIFRRRCYSNEAHHIIARRHGGKNTLNNGITLCKFCHQYFDHMYSKFGYDYFEIIRKKSTEQRIRKIRELMRKRYTRHLLNIIFNW